MAPRTRVLGILNVTPDSFSDGGRVMRQGVVDVAGAVALAEQLFNEGADAVDLGGARASRSHGRRAAGRCVVT